MHNAKSWRWAHGPRFVYSTSSEDIVSVSFIGLAALVMLLPTILNRYLFLDETWYVDHIGNPSNVWTALGRPLLHYVMLVTEHVEAIFGLGAIYVYRLAGVLLLATTGALIFGWLRKFDYSRFSATLYSIGLISLPAFQVLAATSVQLGAALIAALLAAHLVHPMLTNGVTRHEGICRAVGGTLLCFIALCIYQISFLLLFAMLLIPVLQASRSDLRRCVAIALTYVGLATIAAVYLAAWKLLYVAPTDGSNAQYSPDAATLSAVITGLQGFIPGSFRQVANLWHVDDLKPSPFFYVSVFAVLIAAGRLFYAERLFGLLKIAVAIGTLLVCDIFRLAAPHHPPTYTTLHALSTAWWFLFVWSIHSIVGHDFLAKAAAIAAAVTGLVLGTWTTGMYISGHNGAQLRAIQEAMRTKTSFDVVHVFGATNNYPQLYEYGYTSGADTFYAFSLAKLIARSFGKVPTIQVSHVAVLGTYPGANDCQKPDLAIRLPSPGYRCAGSACALNDEQIEHIDWKTCKLDSPTN